MASVTDFIARRLRLKVNAAKSAVARPGERHFLGFSVRVDPLTEVVEVLLSKRSKERIDKRIRELTPRGWGDTLAACIHRLNGYLLGWFGFFGICTGEERTMQGLDAHIRRRLRAILLRQWKRRPTIVRNLIARGVKPRTAWRTLYEGRRSIWYLSHRPATDHALPPRLFAEKGLVSLLARWRKRQAPGDVEALLGQLALFAGWRRS